MTSTEAKPIKPSFASVVAGPPRGGPTIIGQDVNPSIKSPVKVSTNGVQQVGHGKSTVPVSQHEIQHSMSRLDVKDTPAPSKSLNEQAKSNIKRAGLRLDDDATQISSSTNANSTDGKSVASGTNFTFDEKESLRPDDSASLQAGDDDEIGSGPVSGAPNSRPGSDSGGRAFHEQFNEVSANARLGPPRPHPHPLRQGLDAQPQDEAGHANAGPVSAVVQVQMLPQPVEAASQRPPMSFADSQPDPKLFEAFDSPKDRVFLLRLEQDIIEFISSSREPKIQLPPCNSFCRLLTHKLAGYYGLTHFCDNTQNTVTLWRTPFCQLRTPLGHLAKNVASEAQIPNPIPPPAMRIMRRPELSKEGQTQSSGAPTTESSVVPSKAGSEAGDESQQGTGAVSPTDSALAKDKTALTRAEREARYKEKREEIFGPQSENADSNEALHEISRVSSRNEEKKRKKKPRGNNDDFEARSQFNAYYPTMGYVAQPYTHVTNSPTYFAPCNYQQPISQNGGMSYQNNGIPQPSFAQPHPVPLSQQGYQHLIDPQHHNPPAIGNYNFVTGYEHQTNAQYMPIMQPNIMMNHLLPGTLSPSLEGSIHSQFPQQSQAPDMQTPRNGFNTLYHPQEGRQQQAVSTNGHFQFGQVPYQPHAHMQTSSPVASNYPRPPAFNPQTQSFVPNGAPHAVMTQPHGGVVQPAVAQTAVKGMINGGQYPLPPPYHNPNASLKENSRISGYRKGTPQTNVSNSPVASSLSKWGTPANLPPKPPPPDAPGMPESLPTNNQFSAKLQPATIGQPMPHYQNGIYTMPRSGH